MTAPRRRIFLPRPDARESSILVPLLRSEAVGGSIALIAAALAVVWMNVDPASYQDLRHLEIGPLNLEHWAADGALTLFFFVAGLELKREFLLGSLRRPADAAVPVVAAVCGVAVPALVFIAVNLAGNGGDNLRGWAVPAATDIAFALAVLSVVGSTLPTALRAFLLTLAVVDDLVVIIIIAIFYTDGVELRSLIASVLLLAAYSAMQKARVRSAFLYLPVVIGAWWLMYESGVHATIAGVALGLLTRVLPDPDEQTPPAERLEHRLSPISSTIAVPFFALMSAGVSLSGLGEAVGKPLVLGIVIALVAGKPIGILVGTWTVTRFTRAELDDSLSWWDLAGIAVLGGIGFTVSLLVSDLAFTGTLAEEAKTAVLAGSVLAALLGAALLGQRSRYHREDGR